MPSTVEINDFLGQLEKNHYSSAFVMVPRNLSQACPGVREYAWLSSSYIYLEQSAEIAEPVEYPQNRDRLFLVTRNLGLTDCSVTFECYAKLGKLRLDRVDSEGVVAVTIPSPTNVGFEPLPVEEEVEVSVSNQTSRTELLGMKTKVIDPLEARELREQQTRTLAFRFDD